MGDPAGVGPEVVARAVIEPEVLDRCRPLVVGDAERMAAAVALVGGRATIDPDDCGPDRIWCRAVGSLPADLRWGEVQSAAGEAAYRYVAEAARLAVAGEVDAICTAPLNKEALQLAGHRFPGHTELLAHLTGTEEVSMMLTAPGLRVIHVTTHIGLIDAVARIEPGLVGRTIERADALLRHSGVDRPRIAVCGINPHAGENGLFGHGEEDAKIVPAVTAARAAGIDVVGPLPADTLFFRARRGEFDVVVAMYHDQGHGPVKVLGLEAGVNITVGLPVVRTSVDHGTAFDIAGSGRADHRSMVAALHAAVDLATDRSGSTYTDLDPG
jgi:4-hydroxythreonine-4-phosphate dehydrogenase